MRRRHRRNNQRKIIIFSIIGLLFIMVVGYSAFQTNLKITAKGNIYNISEKCFETTENDDGTVSITSYDETCGTNVTIPETIKGKTVTAIANGQGWGGLDPDSKELGAFSNRGITNVNFPNTITEIGNFAFYRNELTEVSLPNSVEIVGTESFKNNQINFINFSENLYNIKPLAFSTNNLTEISLPKTLKYLGAGAFTKNSVTGSEAYILGINTDGTTNSDILNSYAGNGQDLPELPQVKIIDEYAFRDLANMEINLPSTVTTIRSSAFAWLSNTTINIPSQIETIHSSAFYQSNLTINIDKEENSIDGAPWGAYETSIVNWQN